MTERVCQRCEAELPDPQQGAPPAEPSLGAEDDDRGIRARPRASTQ